MKFGEERLLDTVRSIDWTDLPQVTSVVTPLLEELADSPEWLADAMENLIHDRRLVVASQKGGAPQGQTPG